MAGPITWRSITAPSDASGVSLLNQAGQSFNNAFGAFDKAIGNVTQNRQKEYDHLVDTNTQAFMDEVAKYRTAEELQAARDAGVFDRMRSGFNGDVNSQQIRDLVPEAVQKLQQRQLAGFQHEDALRTRAEKGDIDLIKSLFQDGKTQQGNQMLDELTLSDEASLRSFRDQLLRQRTQDGRESERFNRERLGWAESDEAKETQKLINQEILSQATKGQEYNRLVQSRAETMGFTEPGVPFDPTKATQDQLDGLAFAMQDAVLPESGSQVLRDLVTRLSSSGRNITAEQLMGARALTDSLMSGNAQMAAVDAAQVEAGRAKIIRDSNIEQNPLYEREKVDPYTAAGDLAQKHADKLEDLWGWNRKDTLDKLTEALSEGHIVNEKGERIRITPSVVDMALTRMDSGNIYDDNFEAALTSVLKSASFRKYYDEFNKVDAQLKEYDESAKGSTRSGDSLQRARFIRDLLNQ